MSITNTPTTKSIYEQIAKLRSIADLPAAPMNNERFEMTVTTDDVKVAAQAISDKHNAFEAAKKAFIDADAALQKAEHATEHAKHNDDAAALVQGVEDAHRALRVAKTTATVAASQLASAKQNHATVLHASLQGAFDEAKAGRLAACERADKARAEMAAAEKDFHDATATLTRVHSSGRARPFDGALLAPARIYHNGAEYHFETPSADEEQALWASVRG